MYDVSLKGVEFEVSNGEPKTVRFRSPLHSGCPAVDNARAYLYETEGADEGVVFVHGMGKKSLRFLHYYPRMLSKRGFSAVMPVLPFHYDRVSADHTHYDRFIGGPTEVMEQKFRHAVSDVRACVELLRRFGCRRIHIMGISSGGMIAVIAMAIDSGIDRGVLAITGGNLEVISWHSIATRTYRAGKSRRAHRDRSNEIRTRFDECAESFRSVRDLDRVPSFFRYDPSLFAKLITPDRVLMFSALVDVFIPRKSSDDLYRRLGRPERIMLPSGHLGAHVLFRRLMLRRAVSFFRR
ncbi:MAG: alpha/beta hydrolase [Spirochaetes bacterium]|nr:alpha/beta hydrolase [Spirochaetota bacterium]